jgi:hypothetical protein
MLSVAFALNCGLFRTFMDAGKEGIYADQGYGPMLEAFLENPHVKFTLFFEGVTTKTLVARHPDVVRLVKAGLAVGQFELGTYTYNHPVLTMLPYEDSRRQFAEGLKVDRDLWGVAPVGTMLPEAAWDPTTAEIMNELGIEWVLVGTRVYRQDFPSASFAEMRRPFRLRGTGNSEVTALCHDTDHFDEDEPIFYLEGAVVDDAAANVEAFRRRVAWHHERGSCAMVVKNDGEFLYECSLARKYGRGWQREGFAAHLGESIPALVARGREQLSQALAGYAGVEGVQFCTVGEVIRENPPASSAGAPSAITLRSSARGYREWFEGSEKVAAVWEEARSEIKAARYAILVAAKAGLPVTRAQDMLEQAWLKLLEAEISTGRRACAHEAGKASRIIRSLDLALEACRLAQQSAESIGT